MYLALFLSPWVLMYALSTMAMNHRPFFQEYYGGTRPSYELERELACEGQFPAKAGPHMVAQQILGDLDMDGSYRVRGNLESEQMTIQRHHPVGSRSTGPSAPDAQTRGD